MKYNLGNLYYFEILKKSKWKIKADVNILVEKKLNQLKTFLDHWICVVTGRLLVRVD